MKTQDSRTGSIVLATLLIIMILSASSGYLLISFNEYKLAKRNESYLHCLNLLETGVDEATLALNTDTWTGWTEVEDDHYYKKTENIDLGNNKLGTIRVYVSLSETLLPIIFAEGAIVSPDFEVKKQARVDLARKSLFSNGLTAKNSVTFKGNQILIDSYDSEYGNYDYVLNRSDQGMVACPSIAGDAVSNGNADIWGYVGTNGSPPAFGPNSKVKGTDTPAGVDIDWNRIALNFNREFPDVEPLNPSSPVSTVPANGAIGTIGATEPTYYKVSSFSNKVNEALLVNGPVVLIVDGDFNASGVVSVAGTGSLELYVGGNMNIGSGDDLNLNHNPGKMVIYGTNKTTKAQTITIKKNLRAAIYAPNCDLELKGNGDFMGAAVANKITFAGNVAFHYDEALRSMSMGSYRIDRWRELVQSDEKVPLDSPDNMAVYAVNYPSQKQYKGLGNLF